MREVIKTAPTVDEAIQLALTELGVSREQVTAEIIDYPEKKFFFKKPAKVKVTELEADFNVKEFFASDKTEEAKPKEDFKAKDNIKPREAFKAEPVKPASNFAQKPVAENKPAPQPRAERNEFAKADVVLSQDELSDKVKYALEFLNSVISQFYTGEYTLVPTKSESGCVIKIQGEDAGSLIGRKGETMEAISYLTSLAANRSDESFEKISVDVAGYRQKREKDLQITARKTAIRVAKTGRPYTFEPMNPYDRRVVHAAVSEIAGVKSESKGEGSARRVMVISTAVRKPRPPMERTAISADAPKPSYVPTQEKPFPVKDGEKPTYNKDAPRTYNRGGRRPYNKDVKKSFTDDYQDRTSAPVQKNREEKLVDDADTALYSKIEL
ncbi:MAG: RNA-binding cell elongation regulator Jag/EloR [Oscillospiraceae bacterium]